MFDGNVALPSIQLQKPNGWKSSAEVEKETGAKPTAMIEFYVESESIGKFNSIKKMKERKEFKNDSVKKIML